MKTIKFYKTDTWYADVDGHTQEENEMVCGADTFIDFLSVDGKTCTVDFSDTCEQKNPFEILTITEHDDGGAWYKPTFSTLIPEMYLCNVMHTVCGEHPDKIYIYNIR